MDYYLMNKDHQVLKATLREDNCFTEILEKIEFEYAPLALNAVEEDLATTLNHWYHCRYIPDYRFEFYELLENLDLFELYDYHPTFYSFSMTDHYWIKPVHSPVKYEVINQMKKDVGNKFLQATFFHLNHPLENYNDPNITTEGMLPKSWIIEDGRVVLLKGTIKSNLEPYCEVFASMIGKHLGMDICEYRLKKLENHILSACDSFIDDSTELVNVDDILNQLPIEEHNIENYLEILLQHGIDASNHISDMYLLDFLILNTDRHSHNFGIIRNVDTLEWVKVAPLFDHGTSFHASLLPEPKYFFNKNVTFDYIKGKITKHYDLSNLEIVYQEFREYCKEYPIQEEDIEKMIEIVKGQVKKIA